MLEKSFLLKKADWRIQADQLRERVRQSPEFENTVSSLSLWFDVLKQPPYTKQNADERLKMAFASNTDHPVIWCTSRAFYLSPSLEISLNINKGSDAPADTLEPLTKYVLGRACMRSMLVKPSNTLGLSLAYGLLWPMNDGFAYAGADDELLDRLATSDEARTEIVAEARRMADDPTYVARDFDRDRAHAIQQASSPASLEACTHWLVRGLFIDVEFGRTIRVIAECNAVFAANLLGQIRNAALVASILRGYGVAGIPILANILRYAEPIFDSHNRWASGTTAWMIVLQIEEELTALLEQQRNQVRSGGAPPSDPEQIIKPEIDAAVEALLSRQDGCRLALEWLAHLLWSVFLGDVSSSGHDRNPLSALEPRSVLLDALTVRFRQKDWADPIRIWALFDGSPLFKSADGAYQLERQAAFSLPLWHDWLGQPNSLVPIGVAVQLWESGTVPPSWLPDWVKLLCRDLAGLSATHQLADAKSPIAARYLARPLVHSGSLSEQFSELWSDAGWQRIKARFSKWEQAADATRPCVALLRVGLQMLELSAAINPDDARALATLLADAIDEARYTLPEMGVFEWSTVVGNLAGVMAATGLLRDQGCEQLFARYDGDDESLAAAVVNAAANGLPGSEINRALASIGVNALQLTDRWASWNQRVAKNRNGQPTSFLKHLSAISGDAAR